MLKAVLFLVISITLFGCGGGGGGGGSAAPASRSDTPVTENPHTVGTPEYHFTAAYNAEQEKNYIVAAEQYQIATDLGDAAAANNLGLMYEKGRGVEKNLTTAYQLYKLSAERGSRYGKYNYSYVLFNGFGVIKDETLAFEWARQSAESDLALAQNLLAEMYETGRGTQQNYEKSYEFYIKSAAHDLVESVLKLAEFYELGKGVAVNGQKALDTYLKAERLGSLFAKSKLASVFYNGSIGDLTIARNYTESRTRLEFLSNEDIDPAKNNLALLKLQGLGGITDKTSGYQLLSELAAKENLYGLINLGHYYQLTFHNGAFSFLEARQNYEKAINACNTLSKQNEKVCQVAEFRNATLYELGQGVPVDLPKAVQVYTELSEKGLNEAKTKLGFLHLNGIGVSKDVVKAKSYFDQALLGEDKDYQAYSGLGLIQLYGLGVTKNAEEAKRLFDLAISNNQASGHTSLGLGYLTGAITPPFHSSALVEFNKGATQYYFDAHAMYQVYDLKECSKINSGCSSEEKNYLQSAASWGLEVAQNTYAKLYIERNQNHHHVTEYLERASSRGNAEAAAILANLYSNGLMSLPVNHSKAFELYKMSAELGWTEAQFQLGKLYREGVHVSLNYTEARANFTLAANKQHSNAAFELAKMEYQKLGTSNPNYQLAFDTFSSEVSVNDNPEAFYMLGEMYKLGLVPNSPVDFVKAQSFLRQAAMLGHEDASRAVYSKPTKILSQDGYSYAVLRVDGSVLAWGLPERGGDIRELSLDAKLQSGVTDIYKCSAGYLAEYSNGSFEYWGPMLSEFNSIKSTVNGRTTSVTAGNNACAFLLEDKTVVGFGGSKGGDATLLGAENNNISKVEAHYDGFIAFKEDGSIVYWGLVLGQSQSIPYSPLELTDKVVEVVSNEFGFAVRLESGKLKSWYSTSFDSERYPSVVGVTDARKLFTGYDFFLAIDGANNVTTWGSRYPLGYPAQVEIEKKAMLEFYSSQDSYILRHADHSLWLYDHTNAATHESSPPLLLQNLSSMEGVKVFSARSGQLYLLDDAKLFVAKSQSDPNPDTSNPITIGVTDVAINNNGWLAIKNTEAILYGNHVYSGPSEFSSVERVFTTNYTFFVKQADGTVVTIGRHASSNSMLIEPQRYRDIKPSVFLSAN